MCQENKNSVGLGRTNAVFPPHNIRRMNPNKLTSLIGQYPGKKTGDKIEDGN